MKKKGVIQQVWNAIDRVSYFAAVIGATAIIVIALIITVLALGRVFHYRPLWVPDLSTALMLILVMLGAPYVLSRDKHIRVDLVFSHLSAKTQAVCNVVTSILSLAYFIALVWKGFSLFLDNLLANTESQTNMRFPIWWLEIWLPVGYLLLTLQILPRIHMYIRKSSTNGQKRENISQPKA